MRSAPYVAAVGQTRPYTVGIRVAPAVGVRVTQCCGCRRCRLIRTADDGRGGTKVVYESYRNRDTAAVTIHRLTVSAQAALLRKEGCQHATPVSLLPATVVPPRLQRRQVKAVPTECGSGLSTQWADSLRAALCERSRAE